MNIAAVYRKILAQATPRMVIDIPEEFRGRSVEILVMPVMENPEPEPTTPLPGNELPIFTKAQIEEWAKTPEIRALSGALKNAGLPNDIDMKKIRAMRIKERYGA